MTVNDTPARPMDWLRVIDLSSGAAGPFAAKLLADYGADVVKVEDVRRPDWARTYRYAADRPVDPEAGALYLYENTNKRGVALDLGSPEGLDALHRLIDTADVLIEDWTYQDAENAGIDYATLHARNPRLIVTSVTPWGRTGPFRDHRAYPMNTFHASGQGYLAPMNSADTSREPVKGGGLVGEHDAGLASAIATLAAVFWRENGGTGQHVDVSKQHAVMHLEKSQLRRYVDEGVAPDRTGMGRLLETLVQGKDGAYVVIILSSQLQWEGLFRAMGSPAWGANEPFDTQAGRSEHYPELKANLQAWADEWTAEEIFHKIQAERSAAAPVYRAEHFMHSEQVAARDYLVQREHPVAGRLAYPGRSGIFSDLAPTPDRPAPLLGQHDHEVLGALDAKRTEPATPAPRPAAAQRPTPDRSAPTGAAAPDPDLAAAGAVRAEEH